MQIFLANISANVQYAYIILLIHCPFRIVDVCIVTQIDAQISGIIIRRPNSLMNLDVRIFGLRKFSPTKEHTFTGDFKKFHL